MNLSCFENNAAHNANAVASSGDSMVTMGPLMSTDYRTPLTRRRFLTRAAMAASAVALPYYIPASALGRDGAVAPSERIVMGGIGIGGGGSLGFGALFNE